MGGTCSAYGGAERRVQGFGGDTLGKKTTGETQAWMDFQEVGYVCMDRIELAQDRDRWQALVNVIINIRDP
jgi:hypothetical protein